MVTKAIDYIFKCFYLNLTIIICNHSHAYAEQGAAKYIELVCKWGYLFFILLEVKQNKMFGIQFELINKYWLNCCFFYKYYRRHDDTLMIKALLFLIPKVENSKRFGYKIRKTSTDLRKLIWLLVLQVRLSLIHPNAIPF